MAEVAYVLTSAGMAAQEAAEHLLRTLDLLGVEVLDEVTLRDTLGL